MENKSNYCSQIMSLADCVPVYGFYPYEYDSETVIVPHSRLPAHVDSLPSEVRKHHYYFQDYKQLALVSRSMWNTTYRLSSQQTQCDAIVARDRDGRNVTPVLILEPADMSRVRPLLSGVYTAPVSVILHPYRCLEDGWDDLYVDDDPRTWYKIYEHFHLHTPGSGAPMSYAEFLDHVFLTGYKELADPYFLSSLCRQSVT